MNKVLTAIDKSGSFRVYLTISTQLVQEALNIHNTTPVATAALGRVLTGAGMMGLMLKNERDKLTLIFKGDGPARQILATADGKGNVKGYIADPGVDLPLKENGKLDVGGAIGRGELTVEIVEDGKTGFICSPFDSDMIVQLLPDASEDAVAALEKIIGDMEPITTLIDRVEDSDADERLRLLSKEIFGRIPEEFAIEELEIKNMDWNCDCSFERLEKILMTIGERDLKEIIEEDGEAELVCQFCLKKYKFDKAHLEKILASIR